jgi:MFS family permease
MIALTIYVPLYLQVGRGISASHSGLALMPLAAGVVIGSAASAKVMAHWEHYKRPAVWGLAASVVSVLLLAVIPMRVPLALVFVLLGVVGIGIGSVFSLTTVSIQNAVAPQQTGVATAALNFFRSLGSAIMVAAIGAIVLGGLGVNQGSDISLDAASFADERAAGQLTSVFRWFFIAGSAGLLAAFASLWRMEERPLRTQIVEAAAKAVPATATAANAKSDVR